MLLISWGGDIPSQILRLVTLVSTFVSQFIRRGRSQTTLVSLSISAMFICLSHKLQLERSI